MRIYSIRLLSLVLLHVIVVVVCIAQQDTTSQQSTKIILADGSELVGTIIQKDTVSIVFKTAGNILVTIPRDQVKNIESLTGRIIGGKYVQSDPNRTRLFFAPTARPLKSGQGYFSAYEIFFPFLGIGITDFITFGGGISMFPGGESQLLYFTPKITLAQNENCSAAIGLLYINATAGKSEGVGIYYGVFTYGDQKAALTAGLGFGFNGSDIAHKPVFMLGGEFQVSNSTKFISENWIPPNSSVVILTFGIRFFGENLAADLGAIRPAGPGITFTGFPFIPWIGFAYNFGKQSEIR